MKKLRRSNKLHFHIYLVLGVLVFSVFIYAFFSGYSRLLNQPDQTSAQSAPTSPVKTALVYNISKDRSTGKEISLSTLGQKLQMWIVSRSHENNVKVARAAGGKGPYLQYIIADALVGASGHESITAQRTVCTASQKMYDPWSNNVNMDVGSFCQIHDNIVRKTAFDHDLNSSTPAVVPTEDWFIHDASSGYRLKRSSSGGTGYYPNPANQHVREYFVGRILREKNKTPGVFDGIFLDNVGLGWENVRKNGMPKEFTSSVSYADAVHGFVSYIHKKVSVEARYPVYGNMISGNNNGSQMDRFIPVLDGAFIESYALNWGRGPFSASTLQNQMIQAEKWFRAGKSYVMVAQGTETDNVNNNKFALAAFLMVTDGVNGYYSYTDYSRMYGYLYEIPEYSAKLGNPKGPKTKVSDSPLIYRREFECGRVDLNITNTSSQYTVNNSCTPAVQTPPPISSPTPQTNTQRIIASEDTYVRNDQTASNFGSVKVLEVDRDQDKQAYFKFKLPSEEVEIEKATLRLKVATELSPEAHSFSTQALYVVEDSSWSENGLTYGNKPPMSSKLVELNPNGQKNVWLEFNVTEEVADHGGDLISFGLVSQNVDGLDISSREVSGSEPYLELITKAVVPSEFSGAYFNNMTLSGTPVVTKKDPQINFDFGLGSPGNGVNADNFSARWEKSAYFEEGIYNFSVTADDGVRLYIDNKLIIDKWIVQAATNYNVSLTMSEGLHSIRLEYFERANHSVIKFNYSKSNTSPSTSTPAAIPGTVNGNVRIIYPRQFTPAFVQPGKSFVAEVKDDSRYSTAGWSASVKNDLRSWNAEVVKAEKGSISNGREAGWKVEVRTATDVPPELLALTLSHSSVGSSVTTHAVSVVRNFETDFYILHMTDEHVNFTDSRTRPLSQTDDVRREGHRTAELVDAASDVVNLINPRFVVNTGDETSQYTGSQYRKVTDKDMYTMYKNAKVRYTVPSITMPGNHDVPREGHANHDAAAKEWEEKMGLRSYAYRLGSFFVLANDYSDVPLRTWGEAMFNNTLASGIKDEIKYRMVLQHFRDWNAVFGNRSTPVEACDLMLIGHLHHTNNMARTDSYNEGTDPSDIRTGCDRTLMTVAAHSYARAGMVSFKNVKDSAGRTTRWDSDAASFGGDDTFGLIERCNVSNSGFRTSCIPRVKSEKVNDTTIRVTSDLSKTFSDGRVRFLMPRGRYRSISGGEVIAQYDYGTDKTAVLLKVTISKGIKDIVIARN